MEYYVQVFIFPFITLAAFIGKEIKENNGGSAGRHVQGTIVTHTINFRCLSKIRTRLRIGDDLGAAVSFTASLTNLVKLPYHTKLHSGEPDSFELSPPLHAFFHTTKIPPPLLRRLAKVFG